MAQGKAAQIDWELVDKQLKGNKTQRAIAKSLNISAPTFSLLLKKRNQELNAVPMIQNREALDNYKKNRADIYAETGRRLLEGVTEDKIKKARVGELVLAHAQISDKERLERGQSTANINNLVAILDRIDAKGIPPESRF